MIWIIILLLPFSVLAKDEIELNQEIKEIYVVDVINGKPVNVRKELNEQSEIKNRGIENKGYEAGHKFQVTQRETLPKKKQGDIMNESLMGLLGALVMGLFVLFRDKIKGDAQSESIEKLTSTLKELGVVLTELKELTIRHEVRSESFCAGLDKRLDTAISNYKDNFIELNRIVKDIFIEGIKELKNYFNDK